MNKSKQIGILSSYGFAHMVVDFVCAGTVFLIYSRGLIDLSGMVIAILMYNILAFGLQTLFGALTDKFRCPKITAILGCLFVATGCSILNLCPRCTIIFVGIGNALFHVGGGVISIATNPKKTTPGGIFVAPGAFGLLMGIVLGKNGTFTIRHGLILLAISIIWILLSSRNLKTYDIVKQFADEQEKGNIKKSLILVILLLLFSIVIRSFVGFIVNYHRKIGALNTVFIIFIVLGKAIGGILADKFGWLRVGVISLLLSIPCLLLGQEFVILGMVGILLFNITMPIALIALIKAMPRNWGLAFGLLCMALLIGALPSLLGASFIGIEKQIITITILISSIILYISLNQMGVHK